MIIQTKSIKFVIGLLISLSMLINFVIGSVEQANGSDVERSVFENSWADNGEYVGRRNSKKKDRLEKSQQKQAKQKQREMEEMRKEQEEEARLEKQKKKDKRRKMQDNQKRLAIGQ
ncbi:hypothetical protein NEHOM01_0898 [Nematocida homosporus]|uniref:uncharacterized protein n=1 Tax=Nematocida homosporus TaxID=1912981 RepID=UPI00221F5580|nr:uncharacterized protein NEHOM01_0898 [Nematocida homosporus]KAI5185539.1 hypothetical protein NEHOM01_0898 [Nematocida homosporus]